MIKELEMLTEKEIQVMLKATALVSIYAAILDGNLEEDENEQAKKLSHLRTYTAPSILRPYYITIEPDFTSYYNEILEKLPVDSKNKIDFLTQEIMNLNLILMKLENSYSTELKKSLLSYAKHISNSKKNFLEAFLFPMDIEGITETSVKSFNQNS